MPTIYLPYLNPSVGRQCGDNTKGSQIEEPERGGRLCQCKSKSQCCKRLIRRGLTRPLTVQQPEHVSSSLREH
ncbi:uncharacterized protein ColSpa_02430 [Colletotrichum spaethianum]|uniref:Uncharacterized protein n=1 Tax=Colletotrichum spaethianum TaxID=700344 RepID=A0AA37L7V7_9PEZI|nr:uncharacterized protein ColSpa_02430 [Colletotrichum spaethianum]GKT42249.1 hypothetical protein ColSpa_02430 [Colletotrichum spaethianum]